MKEIEGGGREEVGRKWGEKGARERRWRGRNRGEEAELHMRREGRDARSE